MESALAGLRKGFLRLFKMGYDLFLASHVLFPVIIATVVGILTGLLAVGFIRLIGYCQTLFFIDGLARLSFLGGYGVILIPAVGGIFVGLLVTFGAPEAKGHGVPEVLKAMALHGGRIRPVVVMVKALASAIAIGSGASVGREGPIIQIGSALGSTIAQIFRLNEARIKNLVACGAAAGISSVFNAPIAGVLFSLEVILKDFGAKTLGTVVISSVAASIVSRMFLGEHPSFMAPSYGLYNPHEIFIYLLLGVLSAFAALLFMFTLHKSEDIFDDLRMPEWLKPVLGGLLLGGIGYFFPQVFGAGLKSIEDVLHGNLGLMLLLLLIPAKIFATSISLGSGSSGGVFAPALFIGSVLGGSVGRLLFNRLPFQIAPPGAYALVGMASVFAAAAHAPVTAILIVFEMTGDYRLILPIMVAVVTATSISQALNRDSIYTEKLRRKGIDVDSREESRLLQNLQIRDVMTSEFETVENHRHVRELISRISAGKDKTFFVVNNAGKLLGVVRAEDIREILFEKDAPILLVEDVMTPLNETFFPEDTLNEAVKVMMARRIGEIPVMDSLHPDQIAGVIRQEAVFRTYLGRVGENQQDELFGPEPQSGHEAVSFRFVIPFRSRLGNRMIKDLGLPAGIVFSSIQRGDEIIVPQGQTLLQVRDKVTVVLTEERKKIFQDWLKKNRL